MIEAVLQATEVRLAEHAVHPVPHVQPGRQHLQMDVATVVLEGARQDLPEELIGSPARLLVEEHRRAEGDVDGHLHLGDHVVTELFAGLRRAIVEAAKRALDGAARSGDDGDGETRQPHEVVDHGFRRRVVHGHGYRPADLRDGQQQVTPRVASVDQARQATIDRYLFQIDERHVELRAQRLAHGFVGDVLELEQDLAEGKLQAGLLREGMLELMFGDGTAREKDLAQPGALGRVGRLVADQDSFQRRIPPVASSNVQEKGQRKKPCNQAFSVQGSQGLTSKVRRGDDGRSHRSSVAGIGRAPGSRASPSALPP